MTSEELNDMKGRDIARNAELRAIDEILLDKSKQKLAQFEKTFGPAIDEMLDYCQQNDIPAMFFAYFIGNIFRRSTANDSRGAVVEAVEKKLHELANGSPEVILATMSERLSFVMEAKDELAKGGKQAPSGKEPTYIENDDLF